MVQVSGQLQDYGLSSIRAFSPTLRFMPSGPGFLGSRMLVTRPVDASLSSTDSTFTVDLAPTDGVTPERWYTVIAEWLDPAGNLTSVTVFEKFFVPAGGGDIATFPNRPLSADSVWVGLEKDPPPAGFRGWWLVSGLGSPAVSGSGDLRQVY